MPSYRLSPLAELVAEAVHVLREVVAECRRPVLLTSMGKDSAVLLHLAQKAFAPAPLPFPLLFVDTTFKFPEAYAYRDEQLKRFAVEGLTVVNPEGVQRLVDPVAFSTPECCATWKTGGLLRALQAHGFDAAFGGARRDEERSRAKERVLSVRSPDGAWDPRRQRPELWNLYNAQLAQGESLRVFPLSNWTELDVWRYVQQEALPLVPLYFAQEREVVERGGVLTVVDPVRNPLRAGEQSQRVRCRFRSIGCVPCTGAVRSEADTVDAILDELLTERRSERAGRVIDRDQDGSMEHKKRAGYF